MDNEEKTGPKLTPEQVHHFSEHSIKSGTPCRFMFKGRNLNIVTGALQRKGVNVIYQRVYWNFDQAAAKQIASILGCKVIISKYT